MTEPTDPSNPYEPQPPYEPQTPYGQPSEPQQPPTPPAGPPPGYQPGYYVEPPKHPQATTVLVLGILGIVLCGILAPFAWKMGNTALREIDAAPPGTVGGRGEVNAGKILGIIGTVILIAAVLFFIVYFVIIAVFVASVATIDYSSMGALR